MLKHVGLPPPPPDLLTTLLLTTPPPQFSLHQIYMTISDTPHQISPLYNVQPTSHISEIRIFPSLPYTYTSENLKFINNFIFQFSDLTNTEYITPCNMLPKYKTCYATHKKTMLENIQPSVLDLN